MASVLSHATNMDNTVLDLAWEVYPVRMPTVEGGTSANRQRGPSSSFGDKVLVAADGDVCDEHRASCLRKCVIIHPLHLELETAVSLQGMGQIAEHFAEGAGPLRGFAEAESGN